MSLALNKVRMPGRRRDVLRRSRLLDALDRSLHRKLTLVAAPAGYGKTTLLVDFARDLDAVACWYGPGAEDGEPLAYARHLAAAFRERFPDFAVAWGDAGAVGPRALAEGLLAEMDRHVDAFTVVFIDDYHRVAESAGVQALMEALLEGLPDQVRLVVASRSRTGMPPARFLLQDQMAVIGVEALRFRAEEIQALLRQACRIELPDDEARRLAERSEGWIASALLAARAQRSGANASFDGARDTLFDFLAEEVFGRLPAPMGDFLLATSVVDEFDADLGCHLLDPWPGEAWLAELERHNLFVARIDSDAGPTYRYHNLLRDFLRERLGRTDPDRARRLHLRAADCYAARGDWPAAVQHVLAGGDRDRAAAWMDRAARPLYLDGQTHVLAAWTKALEATPALLARAPHLALCHAKSVVDRGELPEAEALLDIAEGALRARADREALADALLARAMARRFGADFGQARACAEEALALLDDPEAYRGCQARRTLAICLAALGQVDRAFREFESAVAGFRRLEKTHDLAECLTDLGIARFESGDLLEAQRNFLEVLEIRRREGSPGALASALNNLAFLYHRAGRCRDAWAAYEEALLLSRSAGWHRVSAGILNGRGDLLVDLDEWQPAREAYAEAMAIAERSGQKESLPASLSGLVELERLCGNLPEAFQRLREWSLCRGLGAESPEHQLRLGAIYLDMGQLALARGALRSALVLLEEAGRASPERALVAFLLARAEFEAGRPRKIAKPFGQALEVAARLGHDQFLVVAGRRARGLLAHAEGAAPSNPQLASLIARVDGFRTGKAVLAGEPAMAAKRESVRLEVLTFGTGRVRRNGELMPVSAWEASRSRAVFFYVVDRGGARKAEIALDFWPDFSAKQVSENLHTTIRRIRNALGPDVFVFEDERYRLAGGVDVWHDASEFEGCLRRADSCAAAERADAWRQAIALYQGDYLADLDLDWAAARREELRRKYLAALIGLAEWEGAHRGHAECRALYEKAIAVDPYCDEAHAGLMDCLARSGRAGEALVHFRAYSDLLQKDLQIGPPPRVHALYNQLRAQT